MLSFSKAQIISLVVAVMAATLLLFADTTPREVKKQLAAAENTGETGLSFDAMISESKASLSDTQNEIISKFEKKLTGADKAGALDSIIKLTDSFQKLDLSAYYMEQLAMTNSTATNWIKAGERFIAASRFAKPEKRQPFFDKASAAFQKATELDPSNVEAKISLAATYVEGSADPMKGIALLREVEKTDSNNLNLQLSFAYFSEKSGQYPKVIERFNKVLRIDPNFIEAYLHLADAYEKLGDKAKAIESLEKYNAKVGDPTIQAQVNEYINKLKKS